MTAPANSPPLAILADTVRQHVTIVRLSSGPDGAADSPAAALRMVVASADALMEQLAVAEAAAERLAGEVAALMAEVSAREDRLSMGIARRGVARGQAAVVLPMRREGRPS